MVQTKQQCEAALDTTDDGGQERGIRGPQASPMTNVYGDRLELQRADVLDPMINENTAVR